MSREEMLAEIAWIDQILDALSDEGANDTTFSYRSPKLTHDCSYSSVPASPTAVS